MLCSMEFGVFLFFAGWVVIMTLFTAFFIVRTPSMPSDACLNFWLLASPGSECMLLPWACISCCVGS